MPHPTNKATPGPWTIVPRLHAEMFCAVMGADGQLVVNLGDGGNGIEAQNANAHLISAAPDLLTALKSCMARLNEMNGWTDAGYEYGIAKAAVAKAEVK